MKAVVINCSAPHYNLGARKCADWLRELGYQTHYHDGDPGMWELDADLVALSCIFSWHAPLARTIALRMKEHAEVWAGGPGLFTLAHWWQKETGLNVVRGLDSRFDRQRGHYKMCFASRGCPVNCSFSVTGDTYIHTRYGWEMINTVRSRLSTPEIRCINGTAISIYPLYEPIATLYGEAIATDFLDEGLRPVYDVALNNGLSLRATAEHPLLCVDEGNEQLVWKRVSDIVSGEIVALRCPDLLPTRYVELGKPSLRAKSEIHCASGYHLPPLLNEDLGWLIGFLIGDGNIPVDGRPAIHFAVTAPIKERLSRIIEEQFGLALTMSAASNTEHMEHGWVYSRPVREFFTQVLGIDPADKLRVPSVIFASPRSVIEAFLNGLFDADGHKPVNRKTPYLTTISRQLANEVALLMLSLGQFPQIHTFVSRGFKLSRHYRVSQRRKDFIPSTHALYKSEKSGLWYWRTQRGKERRFIERQTLRESGLEHPLNQPGWFYTTVTSIVPAGEQRVYDLTVPEGHAFIANGVVAHNCIVPRLEGLTFSFDPDFIPAPVLCDNNLSALPVDYQQHIITRYQQFGVPLLDANSGFEPRTFDEMTYKRWKPLLRGPWRFAFDEMREREDVQRMMLSTSLRDESPRRKQVYCLIENEPIETCYERAMHILDWGGEPFVQYMLPLNWLGDPTMLRPRFDWTYQLGKDFMRYFNRHLWRSFPIWEYRPRQDESLPFVNLRSLKTILFPDEARSSLAQMER
jgi:hypothetical protein